MLNFNRIKKTHAFSEREEQGLPAYPPVDPRNLPGIQRGLRPQTTDPGTSSRTSFSSFAPNITYKDYEQTYNEAMTYDPSNPESSMQRRPSTVDPSAGRRKRGHARRLKPLGSMKNSHIVRAQPITNPPVGAEPESGKHTHFVGGEDVGDTCSPSIRTCVDCRAVPVETMHTSYQMVMRAQVSDRMPVLFVSMGDVMHTMDPKESTHLRLSKVSCEIQAKHKIKAVVVVSACYTTFKKHCITTTPIPATLHDHPCENMMDFEYTVPGCPSVGRDIASMLNGKGIQCTQDNHRGLDHGTWLAMHCLFPDPDEAPQVCQLSLVDGYDTDQHLRLGEALDELRDQGILILCVGNAVSSKKQFDLSFIKYYKMAFFRAATWSQDTRDKQRLIPVAMTSVADWAEEFDIWLSCLLQSTSGHTRNTMVMEYKRHPLAALAHPTAEMITPLIVALGAASLGGDSADCIGRKINSGFQHSLSMSAFKFG